MCNLKGRFTGYGTATSIQPENDNPTPNSDEYTYNKWEVTGYFKNGSRKGFCTVTTENVQIKGNFDKDDQLNGSVTVQYLMKGTPYKTTVNLV